MRILVTAGNTQTPVDQVRCLTNIFSGRTGTQVALRAHQRGHDVCLLTSHPAVVGELALRFHPRPAVWVDRPYRTFDELHDLMAKEVRCGNHDVVIHAAAVSDYHLAGAFSPTMGTAFDPATGIWNRKSGMPKLADVSAGKVKSSHNELWLRLVPAPKLVDMVRRPWGFGGTLVKFKLEVGVGERELEAIAEASRVHSGADLMVANTLAGMADWALVGAGGYARVRRTELGDVLLSHVESLARSRVGSLVPGQRRNTRDAPTGI